MLPLRIPAYISNEYINNENKVNNYPNNYLFKILKV